MKKRFCLLLAFAMLLSLLPAAALAEGGEIVLVDEPALIELVDANESGTARIASSPAGADVYIDGALYRPAVTPCELPLSAGEHSLSIRMHGYDSYDAVVRPGDSVDALLLPTIPDGPNVRRIVVDADDHGQADGRLCKWEFYERFVIRGEPEPEEDWEDPIPLYACWAMTDGISLREAIAIVMNDNGWYDEEAGLRWHYVIEFSPDKDVYTQYWGINCFGRGTGSWVNGEELFIRYTYEDAYEDQEAKAAWSHDGCFTVNGDRDRDGTPDVTLEGWDSGGWDGRWNLNLTCSDAHVVGVNFAPTMHVGNSVPFWQPKNYFDMREIYITGCRFEATGDGPGRFFGCGGGGSLYGTAAEGYGLPGTFDLDGFYITGCEFDNCQLGIICAGADLDYGRVKNLVIQGNRLVNGEIFVRNVDAHTWYMWYNSNPEMAGTMYGEDCIGVAEYNILEDVTISGNLVAYTAAAIPDTSYDSGYGSAINIGNSNLGGCHNTMRNVTVRGNRTTLEQANIDAFQWWGNAGVGISNADLGDDPNASYPAELASQLTQVSDNLFDGLTVEYNDFRINCFNLKNITFAGTAQVGTDNYFRNIRIENNRIETVKGLHFYGASGTSNPGVVTSGMLENLTVADNAISVLRKTGWGPDSNINTSGEQDDYGILLCGAHIANYETNWDEPGEAEPWDTLDAHVSGVRIVRNTVTGFANGVLVNGVNCERTHYVSGVTVKDVTVSCNTIVTDGVNRECRNDGISLLAAIDGGVGCAVDGVKVIENTVTANNGLLAAGFFSKGTSRYGIRDNQVRNATVSGNRFIYQAPNDNGGFPIVTADVACTWGELLYPLGENAVELAETDNSAEGYAWGVMDLAAVSRKGVSGTARFLAAVQACSDAACGEGYIEWSNPEGWLFLGVCDTPNYRPGNCHRYYLCPGESTEPHEHSYGLPVWAWAEDYSAATATFSCVDGDDTQVVDATITRERTEPGCTEGGKIVYTATAVFLGKTFTDTKEELLPALGHSYGEPVWTWAEDYSAATASFTCADGDDTQVVNAEVNVRSSEPTHTEPGQIVYTASVRFEGKEYSDSKEFTIPPRGHSYGEPVWTWDDDCSAARAAFTCSCGDVQVVDATITSERTEPTTEADGKIVYTATVVFRDHTYTDRKTVILPKLPVDAPELTLEGMSTKGVALRWPAVEGAEYFIQRMSEEGPLYLRPDSNSLLDERVQMGKSYRYTLYVYLHGVCVATSEELEVFYNPFADVSGKKTIEYVAWAFNNGIVTGTSATTFTPDAPCSRVQFVMMLWKMHGSPIVEGKNPFSDISGKKTTNAILWALDAGVIVEAEKFHPNDNISRAQIVMILWKLAGSPEVEGENPFVDVSGKKTTKAVLWAYQNEITKGTDKTHFAPDADCTRVQLVVFLYKYNGIYHVV